MGEEKKSAREAERDVVDEFLSDAENIDGARRSENARLKNVEFARRRRLATTAIAALGVFAAACAVFAFARDRWAAWDASGRGAVVFGSLAALYAVAGTARRLGEAVLSNLAFLGGSALFGAGVVLLGEVDGFADGVEARSFGFWALGVFALATSLSAKTLHYLAATALTIWIFRANSASLSAALAFCAIGEYWAWRHKSSSVAAIYFGIGVVAVAARPGAWLSWERAIPAGAAFGLFLYWFGATFRSAIVRGIGLVVGTAALAVGSFPEFWTTVGGDAEASGAELASILGTARWEATICAILFVAVACGALIEGARRSALQFVFAVSAFLIWLVWQAFSASQTFGATGTAAALAGLALGIFALLFLEGRLRLRRDRSRKSGANGRVVAAPTTDAATDDEEFDDFFDAEARAAADAPRLLAISAAFAEWLEALENRLRVPGVCAALGGQFAILFGVFWTRG